VVVLFVFKIISRPSPGTLKRVIEELPGMPLFVPGSRDTAPSGELSLDTKTTGTPIEEESITRNDMMIVKQPIEQIVSSVFFIAVYQDVGGNQPRFSCLSIGFLRSFLQNHLPLVQNGSLYYQSSSLQDFVRKATE
jgi:hypothetical protein